MICFILCLSLVHKVYRLFSISFVFPFCWDGYLVLRVLFCLGQWFSTCGSHMTPWWLSDLFIRVTEDYKKTQIFTV